MNKYIKKYFILIENFILNNKDKYFYYIIKKVKINKEELLILLNKIKNDFGFYLEMDPSIKLKEEVFILNSFKAICIYRLANLLYNKNRILESRILSEYVHSLFGIDIHPAASIGSPFFIDHGTGIVIGSTSKIGSYVKIYQGVTLGAKYINSNSKRHPTIEDNVVLYAHSAIFGNIIIGKNTVVKAYKIFVE